jgi:hypothetical protein
MRRSPGRSESAADPRECGRTAIPIRRSLLPRRRTERHLRGCDGRRRVGASAKHLEPADSGRGPRRMIVENRLEKPSRPRTDRSCRAGIPTEEPTHAEFWLRVLDGRPTITLQPPDQRKPSTPPNEPAPPSGRRSPSRRDRRQQNRQRRGGSDRKHDRLQRCPQGPHLVRLLAARCTRARPNAPVPAARRGSPSSRRWPNTATRSWNRPRPPARNG